MVLRLQSLFGDEQRVRERVDIECAWLHYKTVAAGQVRMLDYATIVANKLKKNLKFTFADT